MNDIDKAGRYLAKRDSAGFLRWLVGNRSIVFHAWIDARRLALPNQRDLTDDLVAAVKVPGGFEALGVELQAHARGDSLLRSLGYVSRLLTEPGDSHSLPLVAASAAVLNLTGGNPSETLVIRSQISSACRLELGVVRRNLCDEDAGELLAGVEAGEISTWQLGWLPLMRGGGDVCIIKRWRALSEGKLPDQRDRKDLGALALVFATLAGCRTEWDHGLRRWNVKTSPFLDEIRAEGREEGREKGREEGREEGRHLGEVDGARLVLLRQGRQKFNKPPTRKQERELAAIDNLGRLESLAERLLKVDSWAELLNGD